MIIRKSKFEDIDNLRSTVRPEDKREVETLGRTIEESLCVGFGAPGAYCKTFLNNENQVLCMYGVIPINETTGSIWLLGSTLIQKHKKSFLKNSRKEINKLHKKFSILTNYVDSRNSDHIDWLKWCGFKVDSQKPVPINNVDFYSFVRVSSGSF